MKRFLLIAMVSFVCGCLSTADRPSIILAKDGFPSCQDTPEGAACDFSRAFIDSDIGLLKKTCLKTYGSGLDVGKKYDAFLAKIIKGTQEHAGGETPHPLNPKIIEKVFSARYLSMNGPGSYGYAVHNFQEVMFVDIGTLLHNGSKFVNRTMVVQKKDAKWYVHPCPTIDDLLSAGLNQEDGSTQDFRDKYKIVK